MTTHDDFSRSSKTDNQDNQLVISYELLCLLQWLIDHDAEKVKRIIVKALANGLKDKVQQTEHFENMRTLEDMQQGLADFFGTLETLLLEALHEHAIKHVVNKNLMPAIDQIDSTVCDDATVRFSIEKASSKIENNPKENPQDLLFKEILKRWKPSKKNILN